ncbi:glycoside hydrolase family 99-like domain-containing protein [Epilithonimonas sp. UC225_85]|uniref:glycosyltransferase WbsX family protein n=1 Tax=Epilithonimonas sp. UC225_85 TaxID=3350167 RepID=UPI0036D29D62
MTKIRPIAIHLPQFHPFPENDKWWGKGFTEWTNVTKTQPLFEGHYQPHLPADLGFYDLRLEEARLAQIALAKEFGIYGFCYYHYWFNGKRLMNEPIDRMLKNPKEDFPFMLCWANENWSRAWDGNDKELLIDQKYSSDDDRDHIKFLLPIFKDSRYIKIEGKPVFVIYKSDELPSAKETIKIWREEAAKEGLELYICRMDRWNTANGQEVLDLGFDAAIDFQPLSPSLVKFKNANKKNKPTGFTSKVINKLKITFSKPKPESSQHIIDYKNYTEFDIKNFHQDYKIFPGFSPSWDNAARRKHNATIFKNASPELFYHWIVEKLKKYKTYSTEENFIFINAWNEWAEGNHLEPCQKWGLQYLEALKNAVKKSE